MKIKTKPMAYRDVMALPRAAHCPPRKPSPILRGLVRLLAASDLRQTHFSYTTRRMDEAGKGPWLILMNHSSFIDLEMMSEIFAKHPYCIVCTSDGFVGKPWLMRRLGCIPTRKFVSDVALIRDIRYALDTLHTNVLMYPEASYSFDGCATPLPRRLGALLKRLDVPVVGVRTYGAFARDPLYNCLQKRQVDVRAEVSCLLTRDEIREKEVAELDAVLDEAFTFDHFAWQQENRVAITEPFRADGLERILYRCPHCGREGQTVGRGITLRCTACGAAYELDEYGHLVSEAPAFTHVPDWYAWERAEVRRALESGEYRFEAAVTIGMMVDYKAIYMVGEGTLVHDTEGFHLTGCDGELRYDQAALASYSVYSDYFWYEIGDVICIGNHDCLYYCFPQGGEPVAKVRLAAEELYRLKKAALTAPSEATSAASL